MLTATEALSLTVEAIETGKSTEEALSRALGAVTQAAREGKRSVAFESTDLSLEELLIKSGFEVEKPAGVPIFVIRW
jgi:hypothetical protein